MDALITGFIWLLIYALCIALVCYIVARVAVQFFPAFSAFAWMVWAIGGLVLLLLALRLFAPVIGGL